MNRFFVFTVVLLSCWLSSGKIFAASLEVEKARQHGAQGQATFLVIDSTGKPVAKAEIRATFPHSDAYGDVEVSKGPTDTNGIFIAAGKSSDELIYDVKKEGSYKTEGTYRFYRRGEDCVQNGRWQPWNPTNTVVLKEHRQPIAMYAKSVDTTIPARDAPIGFDLDAGDWVAPYGKGNKADIFFTYRSDIKDFWTGRKELVIACTNRMEGFCRAQKDMWSGLNSAYDAPTGDYQPTVDLILDATKYKVLKSEGISRSEYLAFRVRVLLDDKGKIISAQYGKIYGPVDYGAGEKLDQLRFTYYLNPPANERNLEFDPSRNLMANPGRMRVYMP